MEYKYKAFISYRHLEPDMQAAERLQKLLEAYRPPKELGKKKENWRIFRDVSELQSSSDLSEEIRNAVETSEFLIVICSPKYNESKWCKQELTRFRELHGNTNENIITLLVNGLPQEAFPEELTYTEVTTTDENGNEVKVRMDVEPLAANITADTLRESMKKLDTEYLRIAAPLLGCDFNDLFQREKRREAARRRRIFGGVSGVLSLISVISIASAVTINGKNVRIQEQNDQIKEQNSQIIAQNEQIEKKNNDLLVENAGHLAVESENLFSENRLIPAIQKAVEALPAQEEKPVIPEAEYALSRELSMFQAQQFMPRLALKHEYSVEQLSFMGGGKSVVSQDASGVYFWDAETGALIKKISAEDSEFASGRKGSANKLTAIFDISPDKTGTYFDQTGSPGSMAYSNSPAYNKIYTDYVHDVDEEEPGTGGDVYIYNSDSTVWRIDGATGDILWSSPLSEDAIECIKIITDEKYVFRLWRNKTVMPGGTEIPGNGYFLDIIDRENGAITDTVDVSGLSDVSFGFLVDIDIFSFRDGKLWLYSSDSEEIRTFEVKDHACTEAEKVAVPAGVPGAIRKVDMQFTGDEPLIICGDVCAFDLVTTLYRYDSGLKEKKWSTELKLNYQNNGRVFLMPAADTGYEHDVLAVLTNRHLAFVDYETGEEISTIALDCEVVDASFTRTGLVMFTGDSGEEYLIALGGYVTGDPANNAAYLVQTIDTAVSMCSYSRGKYATAGEYSNTAYIQYGGENQMFTRIGTGEHMYSDNVLAASEDGSFAAVSSSFFPDDEYDGDTHVTPHFFLYSTKDSKLTEIAGLEGYRVNSAAFIGSSCLVVNANAPNGISYDSEDRIYVINTSDLSVKQSEDAPSARRSDLKLVPSGEGVYYINDAERNLACITADGNCSVWAKPKEGSLVAENEITDGCFAVCGDRAAIYAYFGEEDAFHIDVYSFTTGQSVTLDCDLESDKGLAVRHIFWQNSDTVGVFFANRTVALFDAATGAQKADIQITGVGQEPVSVAPVTDDTFAVLCRDSCIYEMNAGGMTGRSCRLEFGNGEENSIYGCDSTNAAQLETSPYAGDGYIYVVWDDDKAWLLDTVNFAVRYRIDDFSAAPAGKDIVFISDDMRSLAGFFPVYTTEQLLSTAREYLKALGEG